MLSSFPSHKIRSEVRLTGAEASIFNKDEKYNALEVHFSKVHLADKSIMRVSLASGLIFWRGNQLSILKNPYMTLIKFYWPE